MFTNLHPNDPIRLVESSRTQNHGLMRYHMWAAHVRLSNATIFTMDPRTTFFY